MPDITAKREPGSYKDIGNNQGVATQSMLSDMSVRDKARVQKRLNKKSTWDTIVGGVKDVLDVGKGVMDIANSYEDLQVKDEQIEASKVNRQLNELRMEQARSKLVTQSAKNDLELRESRQNNEFLTKFSDAIANEDYNSATKVCLENPTGASNNTELVQFTADRLEAQGNQEAADNLRLSCYREDPIKRLQNMYASGDPSKMSVADQEKYTDFRNYIAEIEALKGALFSSDDNITKLGNLGLGESKNLSNDLLTQCTSITTSTTLNDNLSRQAYNKSETPEIDLSSNLSTDDTDDKNNGKNVQYMDVTCKVNDEFKTERFVFNANDKILVNKYNNKGIPTGTTQIPIGAAVKDLVSKHSKFMQLNGAYKKYTPKVTTKSVVQEQEKLATSTNEVIDKADKKPVVESKVYETMEENFNDTNKNISKEYFKLFEPERRNLKAQEVDKFMNDSTTRRAILKVLNIQESEYTKLSPAEKNKFANYVVEYMLRGEPAKEIRKILSLTGSYYKG